MHRAGTQGLIEDLHAQREFVSDRVPVYRELLGLLASSPELLDRLEQPWSERTFFARYDRPLLLMASLRYDAWCEGPEHPLWSALVADPPEPSAIAPAALEEALAPSRARLWNALSHRVVQTNETSRAVAWLWPAHLLAQLDPRQPVALVDVGTSAGLNLVADELPALWTTGSGRPLTVAPRPPVGQRLGLDAAPLDVRDPDAATWLRACVWPGQTERLARLELAIEAFRRAARSGGAPRLERCWIEDVPGRLADVDGPRVLALQTVVRDYLSGTEQNTYTTGMRRWLGSRAPGAALWVELEVEPRPTEPERSATLRVHLHSGSGEIATYELGRTHPHPRTVFVDRAQVRDLQRALGRPS